MRTTSTVKIFVGLVACVLMLTIPAMLSHAGPCSLITIRAFCSYALPATGQYEVASDEATLLVSYGSPNRGPVYLAQGYDRTNHLADGWLVRAFVRTDKGVELVDGIQLSDGSVWVNGKAYMRADSVQ